MIAIKNKRSWLTARNLRYNDEFRPILVDHNGDFLHEALEMGVRYCGQDKEKPLSRSRDNGLDA